MKKIILLCLIVSLVGCPASIPHVKIPPELMVKPEPLQKL